MKQICLLTLLLLLLLPLVALAEDYPGQEKLLERMNFVAKGLGVKVEKMGPDVKKRILGQWYLEPAECFGKELFYEFRADGNAIKQWGYPSTYEITEMDIRIKDPTGSVSQVIHQLGKDFYLPSFECVAAKLARGPEVKITDHRKSTSMLGRCDSDADCVPTKKNGCQARNLIISEPDPTNIRVSCKCLTGPVTFGCVPRGSEWDPDSDFGVTRLMTAAELNDTKTALELISSGESVNAQTKKGDTALMSAAKFADNTILRSLLEHGADVNLKTVYKGTALFRAVVAENLEGVRLLLEKGADPNIKDGSGYAPLDWAEKQKLTQIYELLKSKGAKSFSITPFQ